MMLRYISGGIFQGETPSFSASPMLAVDWEML